MGTSETEGRKAKDAAKPDGGVAIEPLPLDVVALVEAHPVATLATALGLGYTLGGGLFTGFTARLLRLGLKLGVQLALVPALEREVSGLASTIGRSLDKNVDGTTEKRGTRAAQGHHRHSES
ncbi:MAG TPA: hypothetical protein VGK52_18530 [Polyangia bacterium]|jgi:hypothetical protein